MAKTNSKRKTRFDKFPLTLHKTGQFCKKIKGKLYYFGTDKKTALERYLERAAYLMNATQHYQLTCPHIIRGLNDCRAHGHRHVRLNYLSCCEVYFPAAFHDRSQRIAHGECNRRADHYHPAPSQMNPVGLN